MLAGTVERVTFHNADNGFCVLKVQARGKRDLVPVIGHTPTIGAGEWIVATGLWFTDRQHGLQFKAETLKVTPPTGAEGIEKTLAKVVADNKREIIMQGAQGFSQRERHRLAFTVRCVASNSSRLTVRRIE